MVEQCPQHLAVAVEILVSLHLSFMRDAGTVEGQGAVVLSTHESTQSLVTTAVLVHR